MGIFLVWHGPQKTPADLQALRLRFNTPYTFKPRVQSAPLLVGRNVALLWFQMSLSPEEKLEVSNLARNITRKLEAKVEVAGRCPRYVIDRAANPALRVVQRLYNLYKHASTHKNAHVSIFLQMAGAVAVIVQRAFDHSGSSSPLSICKWLKPNGGNVPFFYDWAVFAPWHYNTHDNNAPQPQTKDNYEVHSRFIDYTLCHFVYEDRYCEVVRGLANSVGRESELWP
jgi:hypothetical protein